MTTEHKESECKGPAVGYDFVSYGLRVFFSRRNNLSYNPGDLRGGTQIIGRLSILIARLSGW